MSFTDKLSDSLERLNIELDFAERFLKLHPNPDCESEVRNVRQLIAQRADHLTCESAEGFLAECDGMLAKTASKVKSITVHMVSHAHIDMNWMWAYDETVSISLDTFATMLRLMDIYPEFLPSLRVKRRYTGLSSDIIRQCSSRSQTEFGRV